MPLTPKIFYAYPEALPTEQARGVSVVNTVNEWMALNDDLALIVGEPGQSLSVNSHYQVKIPNEKFQFLSKRLLFRSNKIYIWRLKRIVRRHPGCVVYTRHLKVARALIDDRALDCSVFYEVHEFFHLSVDASNAAKRAKLKAVEASVLEGSAGLVFWNHNLERLAVASFPSIQANRLVATSGIRDLSHNLVASDKKQDRIVYLGSLKAWKGVERLISVFPGSGFEQLTVVGGNEEEIANLKQQCHDLGVGERVEFLGSIPNHDAQQWLIDEAAVAVIPLIGGRYADFSTPIKLFEYMAAGAVVVCPRLATVTDYVRDGVEVHCFDQESDIALIEALKQVRDSSSDEKDIMSSAAKKCAKEYTWQRRAEKIDHFVLGVVSEMEAS